MKKNSAVNIAKKLISFKTTPGNEREVELCFSYVDRLIYSSGGKAIRYSSNGVLSALYLHNKAKITDIEILLCGHLDVVPADEGDFLAKIKGGKMYGRGASDMKGALAVFIDQFSEYLIQKKVKNIGLLITSDEEQGGDNGTKHILDTVNLRPSFALIGDAQWRKDLRISTKEKGGVWIRLTAKGISGHASEPWKAENALEKILVAIQCIQEMMPRAGSDDWSGTCSVASVETSNRIYNAVPDFATAVLDIRFTEAIATKPKDILEKIKRLVQPVQAELLVGVDIFSTPISNPHIKHLLRMGGKEFKLGFGHGASDARFFSTRGIAAAVIGPRGSGWHGNNEWVDIKSLRQLESLTKKYLSFVGK